MPMKHSMSLALAMTFMALISFGAMKVAPREVTVSIGELHRPIGAGASTAPEHETKQYAPIVPADVLGNKAPWAPLTGDGSN